MNKVAILVLADVETHGDLGRVYNALVAAKHKLAASPVTDLTRILANHRSPNPGQQ